MMKFLIAGLGNPGEKYANTRHNIGFKVLDSLAGESDTFFLTDRHAEVCKLSHKGKTLVLIKPLTFMNLSGKAVNYWLQSEKIPLENLLVVTDDIALPFGTLRLKLKGSDGGHNGLKDINAVLNTQNYSRLRFGIGNEFSKGRQSEYVLGEWNEDENKQLQERISQSIEFIKAFCTIGGQRAMSLYNNK